MAPKITSRPAAISRRPESPPLPFPISRTNRDDSAARAASIRLARQSHADLSVKPPPVHADILDAMQMAGLRHRLVRKLRKMRDENGDRTSGELLAISDALDRVAADRYGICNRCEMPVAMSRLLSDPTARSCGLCLEEGRARAEDHRR
jgi:RNA polymerase-binding transcription factor DksA